MIDSPFNTNIFLIREIEHNNKSTRNTGKCINPDFFCLYEDVYLFDDNGRSKPTFTDIRFPNSLQERTCHTEILEFPNEKLRKLWNKYLKLDKI
jgi:hypothetical protein